MGRELGRWGVQVVLWLAGLLGLGSVPVHAQEQPKTHDVIAERSLTPDVVLEALDPTAVRARSLRIGATGRTAIAPRASASLLVTFDTNSTELTNAARRQLDIVASALRNDRLVEYRFTVEGHADPRGNSDSNLALSQGRAESVKRYLTSHGIDGDRLMAEGRGDREPMIPSEPAAPENRRVTFVTQQR
jgi:outer membrane protein OmpA-like peptidoglycan-associated protein